MTDESDTCERCGKTEPGIGWFAKRYRWAAMKKWGLPDPGNLCGTCGAKNDTEQRRGSKDAEVT